MRGVASDAAVVATVAQQSSTGTAKISIYRHDPEDEPTPYNVDDYEVWEELPRYHNYDYIVLASSTQDDDNLRGFLLTHLLIVREILAKTTGFLSRNSLL